MSVCETTDLDSGPVAPLENIKIGKQEYPREQKTQELSPANEYLLKGSPPRT